MLVDVHSHLDYPGYKEPIDGIIKRAISTGLVAIVNCGLNKESNRATKLLAEKHKIVKPAYGFYPTDAEKASWQELEQELKWIKQQKPIAIGEVGMDGKHGKDMLKQELVLKRFLDLAKLLNVPIIVHSRMAEQRCIELIEASGCSKVVLHCFTGTLQLAERAIKNKWCFSIPPIVVYNKGFQRLVEVVPLHQLLTETDSPYLAPKPGTVNEPSNVAIVAEKIAEIKGLNVEEVKKILYLNYRREFE